jgi:hypothetical protein
MVTEVEVFSSRYAQARAKFLRAARGIGLAVTHYPLAVPGRDGEELAVDVAWQGPLDASNLLLLSSGVHGVEGVCGSGVQTALLDDQTWAGQVNASGAAVLYVHALNPYGFSYVRRVTQENVDLNRNFQDFSQPLPSNPAYCALHSRLLPPVWPPSWGNRLAITGLIATQGLRRLQTAISSGQSERPDGLFYTGVEPTWSQRTLRQLLRDHTTKVGHLAWIDLHTGLGRRGHCERGFMGELSDTQTYTRANTWWGREVALRHIGSSTSVSASVKGPLWIAAVQERPQARFTGMFMEFGTQPLLEVMHALRGDHWLHLHPEAPPALAASINRLMFEAFFVDTPEWKRFVLSTVREAAERALQGLGVSVPSASSSREFE